MLRRSTLPAGHAARSCPRRLRHLVRRACRHRPHPRRAARAVVDGARRALNELDVFIDRWPTANRPAVDGSTGRALQRVGAGSGWAVRGRPGGREGVLPRHTARLRHPPSSSDPRRTQPGPEPPPSAMAAAIAGRVERNTVGRRGGCSSNSDATSSRVSCVCAYRWVTCRSKPAGRTRRNPPTGGSCWRNGGNMFKRVAALILVGMGLVPARWRQPKRRHPPPPHHRQRRYRPQRRPSSQLVWAPTGRWTCWPTPASTARCKPATTSTPSLRPVRPTRPTATPAQGGNRPEPAGSARRLHRHRRPADINRRRHRRHRRWRER